LLQVLLSSKIEKDEKKQILSEEYDIPMTRELESEVLEMCNLSKGIREQGVQQGIGLGEMNKSISMAIKMLKKHMSVDEIIEFTELSFDQLKRSAEENQLELVTD